MAEHNRLRCVMLNLLRSSSHSFNFWTTLSITSRSTPVAESSDGAPHGAPLLIEDSKHCSPHGKQKLFLHSQESLWQEICVYFSCYHMEGGFVQTYCIRPS